MSHAIPPFATLAHFKRLAKQLLRAYRENPSLSEERIARHCPMDLGSDFRLADAQRVVARERGFDSWAELKRHLDARPPEQLIFDAVANDDADAIGALLEEDEQLIEARGGWELYRPLYFALRGKCSRAVQILAERGAALDVFEAAALGQVTELRTLLTQSPALVHARREHFDATPLHAARGHLEAARLLLEMGADVNAIDGEQQRLTPLHGRAEHGDIALVELLLQHGALVTADSCMSTPLHCAVGGFQHTPPAHWREVAERLVEAGADINAGSPFRGDPNWTPLHHAAWRNHVAAVAWLLEQGADRTRINQYGSTPIETARYFDHRKIVELLSR